MKRIIIPLLITSVILLLSLAMLPVEDVETVNQCPPTYPGGAGMWLLDPYDGSCWYLHTEYEFDHYQECESCHDGIQAALW